MPSSPVKVLIWYSVKQKRFSLSLIPYDLWNENANSYIFAMETRCSSKIDAKILIYTFSVLIYAHNSNKFLQW